MEVFTLLELQGVNLVMLGLLLMAVLTVARRKWRWGIVLRCNVEPLLGM